jgi:hypothetical protein
VFADTMDDVLPVALKGYRAPRSRGTRQSPGRVSRPLTINARPR